MSAPAEGVHLTMAAIAAQLKSELGIDVTSGAPQRAAAQFLSALNEARAVFSQRCLDADKTVSQIARYLKVSRRMIYYYTRLEFRDRAKTRARTSPSPPRPNKFSIVYDTRFMALVWLGP